MTLIGRGSPRTQTFRFKTPQEEENYIRNLSCEVTFKFKRPWITDGQDPNEKSKTIIITVY